MERITAAGGQAHAFAADLSELEAIDALAASVEAKLGGIDILVNNAARSIRRPVADSLERWHDIERLMQLNYMGPLRLIRAIAPAMLERGDGHIINVATWGVFFDGAPLFGIYNASKSALAAVGGSMETEWGHRGVHTTTLYYPLVKTDMSAPTKAFERIPGLDARRGGRLDGGRRTDPALPDRAEGGTDCSHDGHVQPEASAGAHPANRVPAQAPLTYVTEWSRWHTTSSRKPCGSSQKAA